MSAICREGTLATSFSPRGAQPRSLVMLVLAQVSSMKTSRAGSSRPWCVFQRNRLRATSGRSCSVANSVFFEAHALVRARSARPSRSWSSLRARATRPPTPAASESGFAASRATASRARRPASAAADAPSAAPPRSPFARSRCDHFTALATLTPNTRAVSRQERPPTTDAATRSRRSFEYALAIHADLQPSQKLESQLTPLGNPLSIQTRRVRL